MLASACWAGPQQVPVDASEETAAANQGITLQPTQPQGESERPAGEPGERPGVSDREPGADATSGPLTPRHLLRPSSLRDDPASRDATSQGSTVARSTEDVSSLRAADSHRLVKPRYGGVGQAQLGERAGPWYRTGLGALAIVLVVMGAACWLVRRWIPGAGLPESGVLRVVGKAPLTPKHSATLVQMGSRFVLVGVSPDRIQMLCEVSDANEVAELAARVGSQASGGTRAFDHLLAGEATEYRHPPTGGVEAEEAGEEVRPQPPSGDGKPARWYRRPNRWTGRPARRSRPLTDLLGKLRFLKSQSP